MENTGSSESKRTPVLLFVLLGIAAALMFVLGVGLFLYLKSDRRMASVLLTPPEATDAGQEGAGIQDFSQTNTVTILLGESEAGHGLVHLGTRSDGQTAIESIDGVSARVLRRPDNRPQAFFYFRIDPTFKQQDVRSVRIEVEYLAPQPGTIGIHYDAIDAPNIQNPAYRNTGQTVTLTGARGWQKASFRTRDDAAFINRQNGQADFRLFAKTPILYVRRVTVTREPVVENEKSWPVDFSTSNQVSIALGQEKPEDGLRHLFDESDGRTTVTNLEGILCRHLNRVGKAWGYLYFEVSPSFKLAGLTNARVDVEYLTRRNNYFRLQFNGIEDGTNRNYLPVLPTGASVMRWPGGIEHARIPVVGAWAVATFQLTNANFRNGQNGGADFRLEVASPPEIYVRRVTVTRETP
jgi:hypothetical protein